MYNLTVSNTAGITSQVSALTTNNLTVSSIGKFYVDPGKSITVGAILANAAGVSGLTLKANVAGNSSIMHNTAGISATVQSYMARGDWRLISAPVSGQSVSSFASAAKSDMAVTTSGSPIYYGFRTYNEGVNDWYSFFTADSLASYGNFLVGTGYAGRRATLANAVYPSQDYVVYAGTLETADVYAPVTRNATNRGWNCVGNPYASPIAFNSSADAVNNFITINSDLSNLDPSYSAMYVWNDGIQYTTYTNASDMSFVPVGSAFFVRAAMGVSSVLFTSAMRYLTSDVSFRSANINWTGFDLIATTTAGKLSTSIKMNSKMTDRLDVSYDAGLLRVSNSLALYTHLINNSAVDFAVQCLTDTFAVEKIIPVGLDLTIGGTVTFATQKLTLPEGVSVSLEDLVTGTFTTLDSPDSNYKVDLPMNTVGTNRFFLHLNQKNTDTNTPIGSVKIAVNIVANKINIIGSVGANATASIFSANGVLEGKYALKNSSLNSLSSTSLKTGFYIMVVESEKGNVAKKFRL
jgi:hypothetical protein